MGGGGGGGGGSERGEEVGTGGGREGGKKEGNRRGRRRDLRWMKTLKGRRKLRTSTIRWLWRMGAGCNLGDDHSERFEFQGFFSISCDGFSLRHGLHLP